MESTEESFKPFPEISNHYQKDIQELIQTYNSDDIWVATEKIHGTNFSFICDGETVQCAKRTGILQNNESFSNFQVIQKKYSNSVQQLFQNLKQQLPKLQIIRIFGEFYGGIYPGVKSQYKPIQKTIFYTPNLEFEAFDLFIKQEGEQEEEIYDYKLAIKLFEIVNIPFAIIQAEGTLKELIQNLDPETYESTLYQKFNLNKVEKNFAEGYVLKPLKPIFIDSQRLCIKYKNSNHLESKAPIKETQPLNNNNNNKNEQNQELDESSKEIIEQAVSYINKARYDNIISKLSDDEKEGKKIIGLLLNDAWKDFTKAESNEVLTKANKIKSVIMNKLREESQKLHENLQQN